MQKYSSSDSQRAVNQNYQVHVTFNESRGTVLIKARPPVPLKPATPRR